MGKVIDVLFEFDETIKRATRRFSHFVQEWIGLTSYSIARLGTAFAIGSLVLDFTKPSYLFPGNSETSALHRTVAVVFILLIMLGLYVLRANEVRYFAGEPPVDIESPPSVRLYWWVSLILGLVRFTENFPQPVISLALLDTAGLQAGSLVFFYFSIIVPLPPGRSKVRDLFQVRQPHPAGAK